jgi:hypothetical protein
MGTASKGASTRKLSKNAAVRRFLGNKVRDVDDLFCLYQSVESSSWPDTN